MTLEGGNYVAKGRILVVDDDPDVRKAIKLTLKKAGYDVVEAEDGEKGIEAIKRGNNPLSLDTIISDIQMPKINGMEAVAYFRSQFPSVPVVVITGHPNLEGAGTLYKQGITDYLVKPVEPEKLLKIVEKTVKEHTFLKGRAGGVNP